MTEVYQLKVDEIRPGVFVGRVYKRNKLIHETSEYYLKSLADWAASVEMKYIKNEERDIN